MGEELTRRDAYERRVWRLAFLLAGGAHRRAHMIASMVLETQKEPERLDASGLDRVIVQAARRVNAAKREGESGRNVFPESARRCAEAASRMPEQQMEAWLLSRIDGLGLLAVAKAMDCSKTATQRFIDKADEAMGASLGAEAERLVGALRRAADSLDPSPLVRAYREAKRRRRRLRLSLVVLVVALGVLGGVLVMVV